MDYLIILTISQLLPVKITYLPYYDIGFYYKIHDNNSSDIGYVFIIVFVYSNANSGISGG